MGMGMVKDGTKVGGGQGTGVQLGMEQGWVCGGDRKGIRHKEYRVEFEEGTDRHKSTCDSLDCKLSLVNRCGKSGLALFEPSVGRRRRLAPGNGGCCECVVLKSLEQGDVGSEKLLCVEEDAPEIGGAQDTLGFERCQEHVD